MRLIRQFLSSWIIIKFGGLARLFMYQELIEEGIQDGSIKTEHSKLLAELFVLLTNFWSIPTIYPMTSEEMWEKFLIIKEITDKLGLPIIDDEIVELCKKNS